MQTCPECSYENQEGSKYCSNCGSKLNDTSHDWETVSSNKRGLEGSEERKRKASVPELPENIFELKGGEILAGRYAVLKMLGRGGMGAVFLVRDEMLGEIKALKLMNPGTMRNKEEFCRFMREAKLAQKLMHEGIVRSFHMDKMKLEIGGREHEIFYLLMEYVKGKNLTAWMRGQPGNIPVEKALDFTLQLCRILKYAHRFMIHRDIKPGNIMITEEDKIKLLDFGIAKVPDATVLTTSGWFIGTLDYTSPEQLEDSSAVTASSDLYSVGVMLYEMLTRSKPRGSFALPGDIRSDIPEVLDDLVVKALKNNPEERFRTAQEMIDALEKIKPEGAGEREVEKSSRLPESRSVVQATPGLNIEKAVPAVKKQGRGIAWILTVIVAAVIVSVAAIIFYPVIKEKISAVKNNGSGIDLNSQSGSLDKGPEKQSGAGLPAAVPVVGMPDGTELPTERSASAYTAIPVYTATKAPTAMLTATPTSSPTRAVIKRRTPTRTPTKTQTPEIIPETKKEPVALPAGYPSAEETRNTLRIRLADEIMIDMIRIMPGRFWMGSPDDETNRLENEKRHRVQITKSFFLGKYEITQAQWGEVMNDAPSRHAGCPDCPVDSVSWEDSQNFIRKLNRMKLGYEFRLPTEAEWEYACRAGSGDSRYGKIDRIAWYRGNSDNKTHRAGLKKPNAWGFYDMLGNVWEWCNDWYGEYPQRNVADPTGPARGTARVLRGGSFWNLEMYVRAANRYWEDPEKRNRTDGMRLAADKK